MPLPAALPAIGSIALKYLPVAGAIGGAMPGLREGNLGKAALGSGMGALGGWGTMGGLGAATKAGMRYAGGMGAQNLAGTVIGQVGGLGAQKAAMGAGGWLTPQVMTQLARAGIPLAGAAGIYGISGGLSGAGAQGASAGLGLTAQGLNQNPGVGPMGNPLGGIPPQMLGRAMGPEGNIMDQLDPTGAYSGNRFGRVLGAQTDANVMNILGNTLYGQTERVAKSEMARQAAAAQLKANIEQAKQMAINSQVAGLNVGQQAAADMGTAMSNRSLYRYL